MGKGWAVRSSWGGTVLDPALKGLPQSCKGTLTERDQNITIRNRPCINGDVYVTGEK